MILQAQALTPDGEVLHYENRECATPKEAEEFRTFYETMADTVRIVAHCGDKAIRPPGDILHERLEDLTESDDE